MANIEAVAAESLSKGATLWSERQQRPLGRVVQVDDEGAEQVTIHWRHMVNEGQSSISRQAVGRFSLIPVVCTS